MQLLHVKDATLDEYSRLILKYFLENACHFHHRCYKMLKETGIKHETVLKCLYET